MSGKGGKKGQGVSADTLRRVLRHIRPYWAFLLMSLVLAAASVGTQLVVPILTGNAIDLCLNGTVDGTWLHKWTPNTGRSQQWKAEFTDDGFVRFRSVLADKYLDLYQAFSGNGARAQIW